MKLVNVINSNARRQRAFTMIEIAIALAVIAFALVAIIGILPTGLTAQKQNREETIINQDGPYFLEVIKSGGQGFDHLLQNIDSIAIVTRNTNDGQLITDLTYFANEFPAPYYSSNIVGILSMPKGLPFPAPGNNPLEMVVANVRALSGAAVETGGASEDFAFAYQMTAEVVPLQWQGDAAAVANVVAPDITDPRFQGNYLGSLQAHVYEVRITCRWPLLPGNKPGPNRKTFRTLISGRMNSPRAPLHFFEAQQFKKP